MFYDGKVMFFDSAHQVEIKKDQVGHQKFITSKYPSHPTFLFEAMKQHRMNFPLEAALT